MVNDIGASIPPSKPPASRHAISWGPMVCAQVLLAVLGGMVLDDGFIGSVLMGAAITSWMCGGITAMRGNRRDVPGVLAWSWVVGVVLSVALWHIGGFGGLNKAAARRAVIRSNERQVILGCIAYSSEDPRREWPADLRVLMAWSKGDLDDKLLKISWLPGLEAPFLYVRPASKAPGRQLVLLSDPACDLRGSMMVCYADGHSGVIADAESAKAVWIEGKRLAALPKAQSEGIANTDWAVGGVRP